VANLTSTLTVKMLDQVSGPAAAASASLQRLTGAASRLNNAGGIGGGISGAFATMTRHIEAAQRRLDAFANALRGISTPIAIGGGFLARDLIQFSRLGNQLEAFGNATRQQREELERYAHSLDALFGAFNYTDVLSGFIEMMKQGLTPEQIQGGAARSILAFAQAGGITPADATRYLLTGVTGMRLPNATPQQLQASLARFADIANYIANITHLDAMTAADAVRFAGPAGAAVGMTPEQMGALTIALARAGFQGSEIGVAERSMIVSLIRGGRSQQEAFARLGIDRSEFVTGGRPVTAEGVISGLGLSGISAEGLRAQISAALNDPTLRGNQAALTAKIADIVAGSGAGGAMDRTAIADATRTALQGAGMNIDILGLLRRIRERGGEGELVHIFEGRQFPKFSALLNANIDEILSKLLQDAPGNTQRAAERMNQGLSRAWDNFISNLQKLEDAIGKSGINTLLTKLLDGLSFALDKLSNADPVVLFTGTIALLGTTALAAVAKIVALTAAIGRLGAAGAVGTAGTALGTGTAVAAAGAAGTAARLGMGARLGVLGLGAAGLYMGLEAAAAQTEAWRQANPELAGRIDRGEMMFSVPPPPARRRFLTAFRPCKTSLPAYRAAT
jgi:hypothetical protein